MNISSMNASFAIVFAGAIIFVGLLVVGEAISSLRRSIEAHTKLIKSIHNPVSSWEKPLTTKYGEVTAIMGNGEVHKVKLEA